MRTRTILFLSLALIIGAPHSSAQSLKDKLKKAAEQVGQQVKQSISSTGKNSSRDSELQKRTDAMVGKGNNRNAEDEAPTVRLPKSHTALFAPLGYPVEATYGIKSVKPVMPPKDADSQTGWSEKLPDVYEMDNKSLADEYDMLDKCVADGYVVPLTPAYWRYSGLVKGEILARTEALNEMVRQYDEAMDEYGMDDTYNWVINSIHDKLANVLDGRAYKTMLRSSIAPFFTMKGKFIEDRTKEYFKTFGGYENAVNVELTVWDPKPDRQSISTSESGQSGKVINENASGATVDIGGIIYVLHSKNGKPSSAFISEAVKTAVAGKDISIPDNVIYKGQNYPVRDMREKLFAGMDIKSVKLPSTLREISNSAFRESTITEIVVPASVKRIQGSAFYGCTKLTSITFEGAGIDELHGCFQNCTSLKSVKFPRTVGLMSYDMFSGCTSLSEVILPENLTEIYPKMFSGCKSLKTVKVPSGVVKVGGGAFSGSGITELDLSNVREFGSSCFSGCKALKTVKLNSSLKENFLMETYGQFMECPLLEVKYVNGQYVYPEGFVFVEGK